MRPRWQHFRDAFLFVTTMTRLLRTLPGLNCLPYQGITHCERQQRATQIHAIHLISALQTAIQTHAIQVHAIHRILVIQTAIQTHFTLIAIQPRWDLLSAVHDHWNQTHCTHGPIQESLKIDPADIMWIDFHWVK